MQGCKRPNLIFCFRAAVNVTRLRSLDSLALPYGSVIVRKGTRPGTDSELSNKQIINNYFQGHRGNHVTSTFKSQDGKIMSSFTYSLNPDNNEVIGIIHDLDLVYHLSTCGGSHRVGDCYLWLRVNETMTRQESPREEEPFPEPVGLDRV